MALEKAGQPTKWGAAAHGHDMYAVLADVASQWRDDVALRQFALLAEQMAEQMDMRSIRPSVIAHGASRIGWQASMQNRS